MSSLSDSLLEIASSSWLFNSQKSFYPHPPNNWLTFSDHVIIVRLFLLNDLLHQLVAQLAEVIFTPPPPPQPPPPTHLLWPSHRCQTVCTEWSSPPAGCSCTCPQPWHSPHPGGPPASRGRGRSPAGQRWCTPMCTQSQTPCDQCEKLQSFLWASCEKLQSFLWTRCAKIH